MQIKPFTPNRGAIILYHAGQRLDDQRYSDMAMKIGQEVGGDGENVNNIASINNVLYYKLNK